MPARPRRVVRRRTTAYTRLARQVYRLKQAQYGQVQKNVHETADTLTPSQTKPLLVNLTNAQVEAVIYKPDPLQGLQHATATQFVRPSSLGDFWAECQDDVISGRHKLMYSTYHFHIQFFKQAFTQTVRIDTFCMRKAFPLSPHVSTQMPQQIGQLANMTEGNLFNTQYFKKYSTKFVTIGPNDDKTTDEPVLQSVGVTGITPASQIIVERHLTLKFKHNRVITPAKDLTEMQEIALGPDGADSDFTLPVTGPGGAVAGLIDNYSYVGQDPRNIY